MNDVFDIWISELFVPQHHYTQEPGERPCLNLDKQLSEMELNKKMNESKGCWMEVQFQSSACQSTLWETNLYATSCSLSLSDFGL